MRTTVAKGFRSAAMLWFFERNQERLRLETRYDNATKEYVIRLHQPGTADVQERFQTAVAFHRRLLALEAQLEAERWRATSPVILAEGWPDRTPPGA